MERDVAFGLQALTPTGEEDHWRRRHRRLYRCGHSAAIHVRHAQVGNDGCERLPTLHRRPEHVDAALPTVRDHDHVPVPLQGVLEGFEEQGVIVHDEEAQPGEHLRLSCGQGRLLGSGPGHREAEPHGRALTQGALNLNLRAVALDDAIHHRQP